MKRQKSKDKRQNSIIVKAGTFITLLFLTFSVLLSAQNVDNIDLPSGDGGGSTIGDIITANGKVFVYAADGISIYDAASNNYLHKVPFSEPYGKFNPVYFNDTLHAPDQSIMVYNNEPLHPYIYAITPKMELMTISTIDPFDNWITSLRSNVTQELYLEDIFQSQNGRVILRYDSRTINFDRHRLYVLVSGRDKSNNQIGNFHVQTHFFGIYNINHNYSPNETSHANLFYAEQNTQEDYGNQINNYTFNLGNDYLYLIRLGIKSSTPQVSKAIIDVKQVSITNVTNVKTIEFNNPEGSNWFKMGKVLNIFENGLNKIVVLPYRYFRGTVVHPKFCIIDGTTNQAQFVDCPNTRITDAVFLGQNNDLILSYAPINAEMIDEQHDNSNLAVLHYNSGTQVFNEIQHFDNDNSVSTSGFDINTATYLTLINSTTALISKKDGVAKLHYVNGAYEYSPPLLNAEGNFFGKGGVSNNKSFTLNTVANGLEVFNNNTYTHVESIPTAYQVHHVAANSDGTRLYFYNKLNAYNTGLYAYNTVDETNVNLNMDADPNNNIETAIGDVVYNSFQDQFLVSEFTPGSADITVLNADDNSKVSTISISGEQFAKEMFISPQGRLYVTTSMQSDPTHYLTLQIFDATDPNYGLIKSIVLSSFDNYELGFSYYVANFDYNPYDEKVYAIINVQEQKLLPYNTEASSVYYNEGNPPATPPPGKLLVLSDDLENEFNLANYPYKVVCPDHDGSNSTSQYKGNLFVVGEKLYRYDYLNPPANSSEIAIYDHHFIDMAYSKVHDQLFAVKEATITSEHRRFEIWTIDVTESGLQIEKYNTDGMPVDGQIANIFANPYDGRIYVYRRIDAAKLGDGQVALYSFNPGDPNVSWSIIPLGMYGYHPDYDHTRDVAMFFMTNITTPYLNPYTNHMYLPNGGHSSVSKVEFMPNEKLPLNNQEYDWLSFPRLNRTANNPVPVNDVLEDNIYPEDYESQSELLNVIPGGETPIKSIFNGTEWVSNSGLNNIQSTRGYKLHMNYPIPYPEQRWLEMQGMVVDPSTPMPLYMGKENWVGYFLYKQQNIMDALGSTLYSLDWVKAEDWFCWYAGPVRNPNDPVAVYDGWACDNKVHNIGYGQMVVLKAGYFDPSPIAFTWQGVGRSIVDTPKAGAEYFTYAETADYTPVVVLLDTTETISEIGVFVNDSCVGACTVLPEDTLVGIRAYLDGQPGDSLVFETYTNTKSTDREEIRTYYVFDPEKKRYEHRSIHMGERKGLYQISFKNQPLVEEPAFGLLSNFLIYPNPASGQLMVVYELKEEVFVSLEVYDLFGRKVATLIQGIQPSGTQTFNWNLMQAPGQRLMSGIYTLRMKAGKENMTKKVVIN